MQKNKRKLKEPLKKAGFPTPEIAEKETATNALPMTPKECSGIRDLELVVTIGGVCIEGSSYDHTPALWLDFSSDPELEEKAEALKIQPPSLVSNGLGPLAVHAEDLVSTGSYFLIDSSGQILTVQPMMGGQPIFFFIGEIMKKSKISTPQKILDICIERYANMWSATTGKKATNITRT
jgi:hypothetical protein